MRAKAKSGDIEIVGSSTARGVMPAAANRSYKDPCNYETVIVNYKCETRLTTSRELFRRVYRRA